VYYIIKIAVTTGLVVAISEVSKRSSFVGAVLASIPLVSVLAFIWLYIDTKDIAKISGLATGVFWLVIPSLALFVSLPILLKQGIGFYLSLIISIVITVTCYWIMAAILHHSGVKL